MKKTIILSAMLMFAATQPLFAQDVLTEFTTPTTEELDEQAEVLLNNAAELVVPKPYAITLRNGVFYPQSTNVPKNQTIVILVKNEGEETVIFESKPFNEKSLISQDSELVILTRPLIAGEYSFEAKSNSSTARGKIIAR